MPPGSIKKILLVMKIITLLILSTIMQVSASTYAQRVTISKKNVALSAVIEDIRAQTGYDIVFNSRLVQQANPVTVNLNGATIQEALNACLQNQPFTYSIEDKFVVLKYKKPSLADATLDFVREVFQQDSALFKGQVVDERGMGMPGATVRFKGSEGKITKTEQSGYFAIYGSKKGTLIVSYVGYTDKEITLAGVNNSNSIKINMVPGQNQLGQVDIVSTGYYDIDRTRMTGSVETISKEALQHSSDPNLIKRLEGITTGINFNNQLTPTNSAGALGSRRQPLYNLTIRGKNTLNASTGGSGDALNLSGVPLVVIDNVPSPYSIDQISPNDIESISILRDAASASIWGARAANGVIVIKTKRGSYNRPLSIGFNANVNISDKFNLFYKKKMSVSDYIDALTFRYIQQYSQPYNANDPSTYIIDPYPDYPDFPQSPTPNPIEEILNSEKMRRISTTEMNRQLDVLRGNDVRRDFEKYILRNQITQSYNLSLDGGSKGLAQRLSMNYDKTLNNTVNSDINRLTISYNNSFRPLKHLEVNTGISYNLTRTNDQAGENRITTATDLPFYPFTRLADDQGNPVAVSKKYRPLYVELLSRSYGDKLLPLNYVPLEDMNQGTFKTSDQNVNLNLAANYKLNQVLSVNATYNYNWGIKDGNTVYTGDSFYMRDLINLYTTPPGTIDPYSGLNTSYQRRIPLGGAYTFQNNKTHTQTIRGQLNANKEWAGKHQLSALAGIDLSEAYSIMKQDQYYGYDETSLLKNAYRLNYNTSFLNFYGNPSTGGKDNYQIPYSYQLYDFKSRTFSVYSNAAYTYAGKYTISGSIRKDLDSKFGLGTNKGGTPFYSFGGKWNINNESFYHVSWLPNLSLRGTFGYNGNVNNSVSARPILDYPTTSNSLTELFYASTVDPVGLSNKNLRPEKTGMLNLALDFGLRNNRISGSIEYYDKKTTDLIATVQLDPTVGLNSGKVNTAILRGKGLDLNLNSVNLQSGLFRWTSNFLFSYSRVKVTKLFFSGKNNAGYVVINDQSYQEGEYLSRLYAYKWAGLNPQTGDPMGYLNGEVVSISSNSNTIISAIGNAPSSTSVYFGSSIPVTFGAFRNTFSYAGLSLSANILYKLGYYFRRPTSEVVRYNRLYTDNILQPIEYEQRWLKPGDELKTNVPSLTYPTNTSRDLFYQYAEINVQKADHIRLQEINVSYLVKTNKNGFLKNPRVYLNCPVNLMIWRANKLGIDPDVNDYPVPKMYSFGFSANF